MAKTPKTPKTPSDEVPESKTTVKIRSDLHRKARTLAGYHGVELVDYLDQILRPALDRAFAQMGRDIHDEGDE